MAAMFYHIIYVILFVHTTTSLEIQELGFDPVENLRQQFMLKLRDIQDEAIKAGFQAESARSKAEKAFLEAEMARSEAEKATLEANEAKNYSKILQEKLDDKNSPALSLSPSFDSFHGKQKLENYKYKQMEQFMKVMAPSSCSKWKELGFLDSDFYMIDPDGNGLGEPPFQVHCNMEYGYTSLHHDSTGPLQAEKCSGPKCYSRAITYRASEQQITTLQFISEHCQQKIKIDCLESPLQEGSEPRATWMDSLGVEHRYWAGRGENHMCACGFSYSCVNSRYPCNCDSQTKGVILTDEGFLSDKQTLPVRGLYFGSEISSTVQVNFTLGPLLCTDRPFVAEPHTCDDLYVSGQRTSGFYLLPSETSNDQIDTVYCNMSDVLLNPGRNERISLHLSDYVSLHERVHQTEERISEAKQQMGSQMRNLEGKVEHLEERVECASGWVKYRNNCYRSVTAMKYFDDMEAHCRSLHPGAHLVSIHSQEENDWITNNVPNLLDEYYIGLRDFYSGNYSPRDWRYTDGTFHSYSDWYSSDHEEPNDEDGNEDCVERRREIRWAWNDIPCSYDRKGGVCKYNVYY